MSGKSGSSDCGFSYALKQACRATLGPRKQVDGAPGHVPFLSDRVLSYFSRSGPVTKLKISILKCGEGGTCPLCRGYLPKPKAKDPLGEDVQHGSTAQARAQCTHRIRRRLQTFYEALAAKAQARLQ
jgi:hypothetical protein